MNTFLKTTALAFFAVTLAACTGSAQQPSPSADTDDHHQGEADVAPHGHDADTNAPPSRSRLEQATGDDDHHKEEENVEPHGH